MCLDVCYPFIFTRKYLSKFDFDDRSVSSGKLSRGGSLSKVRRVKFLSSVSSGSVFDFRYGRFTARRAGSREEERVGNFETLCELTRDSRSRRTVF